MTVCRWAPTPGTCKTTYTYDINMTLATQYCGQGNVYVEGTLKGRVTLATSNSIIVTGDVRPRRTASPAPTCSVWSRPTRSRSSTRSVDTWECQTWQLHRPAANCATCGLRRQPDTRSPAGRTATPTSDNGNAPYPTLATDGHPDLRVDPDPAAQLLGADLQRGQRPGQAATSAARSPRSGEASSAPAVAGSTGYLKDYRYDKRLKLRVAAVLPAVDEGAAGPANDTGEITAAVPLSRPRSAESSARAGRRSRPAVDCLRQAGASLLVAV